MKIACRSAFNADLGLLAEWNHQLIRDEGHRNPIKTCILSGQDLRYSLQTLRSRVHSGIKHSECQC